MIELANFISAKANRSQLIARRIVIVACAIIGIGVLGSVGANAVDAKQPPARFVSQGISSAAGLGAMASQPVDGGVELIHETRLTTGNSHVVWMNVTAYCPCPKCCGKNARGITASGKLIDFNGGHFAAAPAQYSFGTKLIIPGYNNSQPVQVLDRGGAIKGNHLDVFFPTHEEAKQWGRRWVGVIVAD